MIIGYVLVGGVLRFGKSRAASRVQPRVPYHAYKACSDTDLSEVTSPRPFRNYYECRENVVESLPKDVGWTIMAG